MSVLEVRSRRLRCGQGWFLLRVMREGAVPGLSSRLVDGHLFPVSICMVFHLSVSVSMSKFPGFYKDTNYIGLGVHPNGLTST